MLPKGMWPVGKPYWNRYSTEGTVAHVGERKQGAVEEQGKKREGIKEALSPICCFTFVSPMELGASEFYILLKPRDTDTRKGKKSFPSVF